MKDSNYLVRLNSETKIFILEEMKKFFIIQTLILLLLAIFI